MSTKVTKLNERRNKLGKPEKKKRSHHKTKKEKKNKYLRSPKVD